MISCSKCGTPLRKETRFDGSTHFPAYVCDNDYCPGSLSARRSEERGASIALFVGVVLVVLIVISVYAMLDAEGDACRADGGRWLPVYGGRGGYVCVPLERP